MGDHITGTLGSSIVAECWQSHCPAWEKVPPTLFIICFGFGTKTKFGSSVYHLIYQMVPTINNPLSSLLVSLLEAPVLKPSRTFGRALVWDLYETTGPIRIKSSLALLPTSSLVGGNSGMLELEARARRVRVAGRTDGSSPTPGLRGRTPGFRIRAPCAQDGSAPAPCPFVAEAGHGLTHRVASRRAGAEQDTQRRRGPRQRGA